jgi:hypothetical protein
MLSPSRVNHKLRSLRNAVLGIAFAAVAVLQPVTCKAQSSDKKNPTPVEGGEIVGRAEYDVPRSGWAKTLYYEITAGPGEMNVTVESWAEEGTNPEGATGKPGGGWFEDRFKRGGTSGERRYAVTLSDYTENHSHGTGDGEAERPFPTISLNAPLKDVKREISKKITLSRETRLLITVNLSGRFNYRIKFDGPGSEVAPQ